MKIVKKFQQGGSAPAPAPQAAPAGGEQDPLAQVLQIAVEAMETGNCEAAMAVCQALVQLAQGAAGPAPVGAPTSEPVFKKGGKMKRKKCESGGAIDLRKKISSKYIGKACNGSKMK